MLISVHEYELLQSRLARALKVVDAVRVHQTAQESFRQTGMLDLSKGASVRLAWGEVVRAFREHEDAGQTLGTITVIHDSVEMDVDLMNLPEGTYRIVKG